MSPLQELREHLGLPIGEMAAALGVSYHAVYHAERSGCGIPRKARAALVELGVDVADLERRQEEWVQERARRLRAELAGRVNIEAGEVGGALPSLGT